MPLSDYFAKRYGYRVGDFPVTDDVFSRSLTLPLYETIALETQQTIAQRIDSLI
jgi:dTDP-4-amino-4,6-dideoxygalactose transaminase